MVCKEETRDMKKPSAGKMILYRGSLKSCNYHCSYCPFSKHPMGAMELEKDKGQWLSFAQAFTEKASGLGIRALLVAPYGEAMIHPWYWEGLAQISACATVDAVGVQTNLSFSIEESLKLWDQAGGDREKLRLWATFHPEMTTVKAFADQCAALTDAGIALCAGAVGVPKNIALLQTLRQALPEKIYLWVNQMDGLKRAYTEEERDAFLKIDPYFLRELAPIPGDASQCEGRLFVEGNGKMHTCNISAPLRMDWETLCADLRFPEPACRRRLCSCYLAYGGRNDFMNQIIFGSYPLFRIPRRPKAVFLDIEGTLLQQKTKKKTPAASCIPEDTMAGLTGLFLDHTPLFFATTLPYQAAKKRCKKIWHLFSGGVFAGGAHIVLEKEKKEKFHYLEESCLSYLMPLKKKFRFQILAYRNQGRLYKITLYRASHNTWSRMDIQAFTDSLPETMTAPGTPNGTVRYFAEGNCLQIVSVQASKAAGVCALCQWIGVSPREAAAAGDSEEDRKMLDHAILAGEEYP